MSKTLKWAIRATLINALVWGTIGIYTVYEVPYPDVGDYFLGGLVGALFPWAIVLAICILWRLFVHVSLEFWIPFRHSIHHVVWLSFFFAAVPFQPILSALFDQINSSAVG